MTDASRRDVSAMASACGHAKRIAHAGLTHTLGAKMAMTTSGRAAPRRSAAWACVASLAMIVGCAAPMTQQGDVSPDIVRAEQFKQQQLVVRSEFQLQQRLDNVSFALLRASVPLCRDAVRPRRGIRFANVHSFAKDYRAAARELGFSDTLSVTVVAKGSPAERAGVKVGDRIIAVAGEAAPVGSRATSDFAARLDQSRSDGGSTPAAPINRYTVLRSPAVGHQVDSSVSVDTTVRTIELEVPADTVCAFDAMVVKDDGINAYADGKNVAVTSGMMRFATTDDELAVVVSHEIAHNAMRHIQAKKKNSAFGAILGAIVDVAAASQGINTYGEYTNMGAEYGAMTFSQNFELEADYVGEYILARAERPIENSPDFWRRMAMESPGSIKFASSHPTTAERFVRLESTVAEINRKRTEQRPLMPEMRAMGPNGKPE